MTLQLTKPKMSPRVSGAPSDDTRVRHRRHWRWLIARFPFPFAVPFVLAETRGLDRDLFYGLYALTVASFVAA